MHLRTLALLALLCTLTTRAQVWNWAVDAGSGGNTDFCYAIATDSRGNSYWTGTIGGPADFGCASFSPTQISGVLAKYDSTGTCLWARLFTNTFDDTWSYGIAIDAQDRIYVTGSYYGNEDFGNGVVLPSGGLDDIFLARFDTSGTCLWARRAGGGGADEARDVVVDDAGRIYIAGRAGGTTITFGTVSIPNPSNFRQVVVACYDSTGTVQWAKASSGTGQSKTAQGISTANGKLYITGQVGFSAATFDGLPLMSAANASGAYVLACDTAGNGLWSQPLPGGDNEGMALSVDSIGNVFVTGRFIGTLQWPDGQSVTSATTTTDDIFLLRMDTSGTFHWGETAGGPNRDVGFDICTDGLGNAFAAIQYSSTIDFMGTTVAAYGGEDILVARVDMWGNLTWAKTGGTGLRDVPLAIHRGRAGSHPIYTGGYFWGTVTYGSSTIDDVLNGDAMMIQLSDTTQVDFSTALRAPQAAAWQLYPVPAAERLHVNAPEPLRAVVVYDALGATVAVPHEGGNTLLVGTLHPGVYLLRATTVGGAVHTVRFAKE